MIKRSNAHNVIERLYVPVTCHLTQLNAFILTVLEFVWTYPFIPPYIVQVKFFLFLSNTVILFYRFHILSSFYYSDYFDVARTMQINVKYS